MGQESVCTWVLWKSMERGKAWSNNSHTSRRALQEGFFGLRPTLSGVPGNSDSGGGS